MLQTKKGPDLLMEANVVQDIIGKSPLLLHKDVSHFVEQSSYDLKEIQMICYWESMHSQDSHMLQINCPPRYF